MIVGSALSLSLLVEDWFSDVTTTNKRVQPTLINDKRVMP